MLSVFNCKLPRLVGVNELIDVMPVLSGLAIQVPVLLKAKTLSVAAPVKSTLVNCPRLKLATPPPGPSGIGRYFNDAA